MPARRGKRTHHATSFHARCRRGFPNLAAPGSTCQHDRVAAVRRQREERRTRAGLPATECVRRHVSQFNGRDIEELDRDPHSNLNYAYERGAQALRERVNGNVLIVRVATVGMYSMSLTGTASLMLSMRLVIS